MPARGSSPARDLPPPGSLASTGPMAPDGRSIDILMLVHDRPRFTRLALERLLATCDGSMRVWIWQNGEDAAPAAVVDTFADHPAVHRVHRSPRNTGIHGQWEPIDWLLSESTGAYVSKVDDDCLVP